MITSNQQLAFLKVSGIARIIIATSVIVMLIATAPGSVAASSAAARVTSPQCSQIAKADTGYVVIDKTTNTTCVTKSNGSWVWTTARTKRNKKVKFKGRLHTNTRGDTVKQIKVRFIRGSLIERKWIPLRPGRTFTTSYQFTKKGIWTIVFNYHHSTIATKVKVT